MLYVQTDAVRTMRRAQWFLMSLPILGGSEVVGEEDGLPFVQRKHVSQKSGLFEK